MKECLLISEPPLQVLPSLAKAIGLNEAIVLQQLYWLIKDERNGTIHDGRRWVYNTIPQWQQNFFPFWAEDTVMRIFQNLEGMLLIDTCQPEGRSRRKYYCLNEGGISKLTTENFHRELSVRDKSELANCQFPELANCQLPITNKEHTKNTEQHRPLSASTGRSVGEGEIPQCLTEIPDFPKEWEHFRAHRRKKWPMNAHTEGLMLKILSQRPKEAIAHLQMAMVNAWRGLNWDWYDNRKPALSKPKPQSPAGRMW